MLQPGRGTRESVGKKKIERKNNKKKNEIVVRHFFAWSFPRLPHGMCNYSQAGNYFPRRSFFSSREPKLPRRNASIEIARGVITDSPVWVSKNDVSRGRFATRDN